MNPSRIATLRRLAVRFAACGAALYFALAVGAPWLLHHAPPSPEDVVAAAVCCAKWPPAANEQPRRP